MNLDPEMILLVAALGILAHVALFALYRRVHPVMLLMAVFALVSMLSTATLLPGVEAIKWMRLYVTVLAVAIAVFYVRPSLLGAGSWAMLGFAVLYVTAALWSNIPIAGVMFKGLFLITLMLGLMAVLVARDLNRLWTLQRCMVLAAAAVVGAVLIGGVVAPGALLGGGRLSVLGLNPNRIAETVAPLLLFCGFGLLYEPAKSWRIVCYAVALPAAALLLATGSRAGFGLVMLGFMVLMLPMVRRPGVLAVIMLVIGVGGFVVLGLVEDRRAVQIGEYDFANREALWSVAMERFRENPLIGIGWAYRPSAHGYSSTNLHSMYFQVLAETGAIGMIVFFAALGRVAWSGWTALRATATEPHLRAFVYLGVALLVAVAGHGLAESGALMGSSLNAACLGISAAMFDWLLATVRAREAWAAAVQHAQPPPMATPQMH